MLNDELKTLLDGFAITLTEDLNHSLNTALRNGGRKQPQEAKLNFTHKIAFENNELTITILASGKYWRYIESGRKKGIMPPSTPFGKRYQAEIGVSAPKIIQEMQQKYYEKHKLKRKVKKLPFEKAVKQLSYLIARGIKNKGIKPKPFFDKVLQDGRINKLSEQVSNLISKEIIVNIQLQ